MSVRLSTSSGVRNYVFSFTLNTFKYLYTFIYIGDNEIHDKEIENRRFLAESHDVIDNVKNDSIEIVEKSQNHESYNAKKDLKESKNTKLAKETDNSRVLDKRDAVSDSKINAMGNDTSKERITNDTEIVENNQKSVSYDKKKPKDRKNSKKAKDKTNVNEDNKKTSKSIASNNIKDSVKAKVTNKKMNSDDCKMQTEAKNALLNKAQKDLKTAKTIISDSDEAENDCVKELVESERVNAILTPVKVSVIQVYMDRTMGDGLTATSLPTPNFPKIRIHKHFFNCPETFIQTNGQNYVLYII